MKVNFKKTSEYPVPEEFQNKPDKIPALKAAFEALTRDGKGHIYFIFHNPNNLKPLNPGLESTFRKFLKERG